MEKLDKSFAILGLSTFGYQTALSLYQLGAEVIVVDKNQEIIQKIATHVSQAICADVLDHDILNQFGINSVEVAIIGLRNDFDITVLLLHHLKKNTSIKTIIAHVDSNEKAEILKIMGVDRLVFPEKDSAERLVKILSMDNFVEQVNISKEVSFVEILCPKEFIGKSLIDLNFRNVHHLHVIGVVRLVDEKQETIIAPPPVLQFQLDDKILVLGKTKDILKFSQKYS